MRLASTFLLNAATRASASILSPAAPLETSLPDNWFRKELVFDTVFLPINPAFISILNFMGTVAVNNFDELVPPHTYTAPSYPQVQISTNTWTEARFLIWGIYEAAMDMVKFIRFHDVLIKLYWNNRLVGQINLKAKSDSNLPNTTRNDTRNYIDDGGNLSLANISRDIIPNSMEGLKTPPVANLTRSGSTDTISSITSIDQSLSAVNSSSRAPIQPLPSPALATRVFVSFIRVPGAKKLQRNEVFLTFYTAILHLAEFPVQDDMKNFDSKLSAGELTVNMLSAGVGCLVIPYHPFFMSHPAC